MILNALVDYYEDLVKQDKLPRPGWGYSNVSFVISLSEEGEVLAVASAEVERIQGKKTVLRPQKMMVPEPVKRSSGIKANFLCDNSAYILGVDNKGKPDRAKDCFLACKELHAEILGQTDSVAAKAVFAYFENWNPDLLEEHEAFSAFLDDIQKGGNIVFRVNSQYIHEDSEIANKWQEYYNSNRGEKIGTCLVTGKQEPLAQLHPLIKGVVGAQSSGASLVSFNAASYCSYGKSVDDQGLNAPVSEYTSFAYGTALNYLLSDREHVQRLGDTTVVFWAKGGQITLQDFMSSAFGTSPMVSDGDLKGALKKLSNGKTITWAGEEVSPDTPFYVLGLAPNAARLSVRFFLQNTFGVFAKRMLEHQERLNIVKPAYDNREELTFWHLLQETANQNSRDKNPPSNLSGELVRAVLNGEQYPVTLLNGVTLRIRADQDINRGRAAIIKAYYASLKTPDKGCPEEVFGLNKLNENVKEVPVAYLLGRAFSILEAIQEAANPGLNATIKDKYINSATTTPALVFPTLLDLSDKHLNKLSKGQQIYYARQLNELMAEIAKRQTVFPKNLTVAEQGSFRLGYYLQTQERFTKKEDKEDE